MRKILILLAIFTLLIVTFLPTISSSAIGKPFFVKALKSKTGFEIEVNSLHFSWFGPQKFHNIDWAYDTALGKIDELQIDAPFWSFKGPFHLRGGTAFYKGGRIDRIQGKIEGTDFDLTGIIPDGTLSFKGKIYTQSHFDIQVDVKNFPVAAIGREFQLILGSTLNLKGTIAMNQPEGIVDLSVDTPNLKTRIHGALKEEAFTLKDPILATMRLTPELSRLLLKDANPLFLTGVEAQNPIFLRVESKGFSCPLPYSLEKIKIGSATLDLGQIRCENGPSLTSLLSLLKARKLSTSKQMNAWFTPVTFQIDQGILRAGRMDLLLADSIHLCTWGNILLVSDQLDMVLGLPADTLQKSFGLKDLPENYVIQMSVTGTTKEPILDTASAVAKITALSAVDLVPKKGVLGGIADIFKKPTLDSDVPPAQRPFPWDKQ